MRIIVAAAGHQRKWGGYLGVPSHLAPVGGGTLLRRTLEQALRHSDDVHVTYPEDQYLDSVPLGVAAHLRTADFPSEYRATRSLWNPDGRTVLLLGDVYFTDDAIEKIVADPSQTFRGFGRKGASKVTGCRYGEMFAASWTTSDHQTMDEYLEVIEEHHRNGTITRPTGWMLLRAWSGIPLNRHRCDPNWMATIDDLTEDWDFPVDYDTHPVIVDAKRAAEAALNGGKGHAVRSSNFAQLLRDLGIVARHVVHVGAHEGEELKDYRQAGFEKITLVEPIPHLAQALRENNPDVEVVEAACGPDWDTAQLTLMTKTNMATLAQPTSGDVVTGSIEVDVVPLREIAPTANVAVVDAQGMELEVLQGADLSRYDLVAAETCTVADPTMASDYAAVTAHMEANGFRVYKYWVRDYQWLVKWARKRTVREQGEVRDVVYVRV